jgi:hypothetical protein
MPEPSKLLTAQNPDAVPKTAQARVHVLCTDVLCNQYVNRMHDLQNSGLIRRRGPENSGPPCGAVALNLEVLYKTP